MADANPPGPAPTMMMFLFTFNSAGLREGALLV
jgi:hypothetical protein